MSDHSRHLTLDENFERLGLAEWAADALTNEQRTRLQQLLTEAGGRQNISQTRFLLELARLVGQADHALANILAERALESAEDETAWLEGDRDGIGSKYWGFQAFLEQRSELRLGPSDDRARFYDVAERHVALAADFANRLRRHGRGPTRRHEHAGYYYLIEQAANEGDYERARTLLQQAKEEGWSGNWDRIGKRYGL